MTHEEPAKYPCPLCGSQNSRTLKTVWNENRVATWRRRLCLECGGRFSTLEVLMRDEPAVRVNLGRLAVRST